MMALFVSTFVLGPIENNTYLLGDTASKKAAVIDPAAPSRELLQIINTDLWEIEYILLTHAHFDHIGGVRWLTENTASGLKIALHPMDLALWQDGGGSKDFGFEFNAGSDPNLMLSDNQLINMGEITIKVLHTPGHTPGHVTFFIEKDASIFCGDLIFYHGIGRTDLATSNEIDLMNSINNKILLLDPKTILYPGHGAATSVGEERDNNPFLK